MKSDIISIRNSGEGIAQALEQAEATAKYKKLSDKDALYLRLLAEEMTGMFRAIAGDVEANFWIEDKDRSFELHLTAQMMMTAEKRRQLLAVSSSGRNEAAKGFMSKLRQIYETLLEPENELTPSAFAAGWMTTGAGAGGMMPALGEVQAEVWSLNRYKDSLKTGEQSKEAWDELEKSVVSKLADDVRITIRKGTVDLAIFKKFA